MINACPTCGGDVTPIQSGTRMHEYRGVRCETPASLNIPTCEKCGAQWLDGLATKALSEAFELQRRAVQRFRDELVNTLREEGNKWHSLTHGRLMPQETAGAFYRLADEYERGQR